jgi:glycosyltransferase involved in cell wall biosynthesis
MNLTRFRNAVPLNRDAIIPGRRFSESCTIGLISGALEPRKRVTELIAALGAAPPEGNWALLIAGAGPEEEAIALKITTHSLQNHVFLMGFCPNMPELIASVDVCLHVAGNEGLPRVVVQYVLGGRPVISTALPGIERVVRHGVNGLLVPVSTPEMAVSAFARLAASPETRAAYAQESRMCDLADWGTDEMVAQIERVYAKTAERKQA